jgi:PKD repeat protein
MQKNSTPSNGRLTLAVLLIIAGLFISPLAKASPIAYFSSNPRSGCAPLLVHFYNASAAGTYSWNFGDPGSGVYDTSTACGPSHIYNTPGTHIVTLTVVTGSGTFTHTDTITVLPSPAPNITGSHGVCVGATSIYSVPYTAGSSYSWLVNGGNYTANPNGNIITVTWTTTGYGDITVTETNSSGCKGKDTFNVYVAALPNPAAYMPCQKGGSAGHNDPKNQCICEHSISTFTMPNNGDTYVWTATNGIFLPPGNTGNTVQVQWGSTGQASISVVATNIYGCTDSAKCIFNICPGPTASFTANNACLGNPTSFNDAASIGNSTIVNWHWDFGDGNTASGPSPSHTYAAPGYYNVTLTITNENGCKDDTIIKVYVDPGNGPSIYCPGTVCAHSKATYYTQYIAGAIYNWTVTGGVGTPNAVGDSIHVVWGAGTVGTITLNVTNTTYYTCLQPVTVNVPIFPTNPSILGPTVVCPGSTTIYTAPLMPGSFYSWTITGDSLHTISGNTISVTWGHTPVMGSISVHMKNSLICCTGDDTIFVIKKKELFITGNNIVCAGYTYTYSLPAGVFGSWSCTGGTINTVLYTNAQNISITWGPAGPGVVTAIPLVSGVYCNAMAMFNVTIIALPLPANITGPSPVCIGSTHTYTANMQPGVTTSTWSVSPGSNTIISQTSTSAVIKWNTAGPGTIILTQTNTAGCSTITVFPVYVVPSVVPAISGPLTACVHDIKTYTFTSGAPVGVYQWSVVGGNVISGYGNDTLKVQWGFSSGGTVTLLNTICGTSTTIHVNIFDKPVLNIDTSGLHCYGTSVQLNATPGCSSYVWNTTATTQSITVINPGTYSVTAYTPGSSCSSTATITFATMPTLPKPVASIAVTGMAAPPSLSPMWQLSASPSGPGYSYSWSPTGNTQSIFVHTTGSYSVIVTNPYGCKDTAFATIVPDTVITGGSGCIITTSNPCPASGNVTLTAGAGSGYLWSTSATTQSISVGAGTYWVTYTNALGNSVSCTTTVAYTISPSFTVPSPVCNTVNFTNTTSPAATAYLWNFGDGSYSNNVNGSHDYTTTGTYTVTLYAVNSTGCWTSVSHNATINVIIKPNFSVGNSCNPTLSFTNTSTIQTNTTVSYLWNFGDPSSGLINNTSTSANPTHIFSSAGTYTVTFTVSSGGCSSTITKTIIAPRFTALFSHCSVACLGQSTQFLDLSIHTSPIVSWAWNFGNGNLSTLQNPWNVYTTAGTYTIKLVIMDSKGCKDSISVNVSVSAFTPGPLTVTGDTILCAGDSVKLTAPGGYSYIWSNGATTQSIYAHLTDDYSVTVINSNGCTKNLGPVHVISHPRPTATITLIGSSTICAGTNVILQAPSGSGYTYNWYHGNTLLYWYNNSSSIYLSQLTDSGVYSVVVTNAFGCKDSSAAVTITVKPTPYVYISGTMILCKGGNTTLYANNIGSVTITSYLWTGGGTGTSITVTQPGTYSLTVTGANGCTYTTSTTVSYPPKPNMSLLPKGCYTICKGYTAVVPAPPGPFTYQWFNGNTLVDTAANLQITSPGTYWLVVTDIYGCKDTSEKFTVTVVPAPVAIITPSGPTVICTGSGGSITLTANGGEGYNYLWSNGETTQSIVVHEPGTYTVIVKINDCCEGKDSIVIKRMNCCFPPGTIFTPIPDGDTIKTSQTWSGKYFIAGKVHVLNHSILDLTEVDLVFDTLGEIIFHDTTIIRANNSVLRPCDMNKTWVGVTFKDLSRGIVHTTLFKNAEIAINVINKDTFSVKLVDNSFVQCHVGVYINKNGNNYVEGITGNSFVIDNTYLRFVTNDYFGIQLNSTFMKEMISQNIFRNATKDGQYKNYYGVFASRSSAVVSDNSFTNMHRSLDILSPLKYFSIENNTIEMTQSHTPNDYQIRVEKNNVPHLIYNNEIRNSLQGLQTGTAAIYVNGSSLMNIKENHIKGFEYGIQVMASNTSQIIENKIENAQRIGIYYNDGVKGSNDNVDIACNEINMDLQQGQTLALPIGIATINADGSTQIRTNCVSNTCHAILVFTAFNEPIPLIKNNYMYNYTFAGIRNINHTGSIGLSSTVFGTAGRNTFVRNNFTSTDIMSTPTIIQGGNYGIQMVSAGVTTVGSPDKFNSTAACGLQINYPKTVQLDDIAICDHFIKYIYPYLIDNGVHQDKKYELSVDKGYIDKDTASQSFERLSAVLQTVTMPDNITEAKSFYDLVTSAGYLKGNEARWFDYQYAYLTYDFAKAKSILDGIIPATPDETDLVQIEQFRLGQAMTNSDIKIINGNDINMLSGIDSRRGSFAATARDMLQMNAGDHDYIFLKPAIPDLEMQIPMQIDMSVENMEAYPNPVHSQLNIMYNSSFDGTQNLKLVDIWGREIQDIQLSYSASELKLNVISLPPGIYMVYLTQGDKVHRVKFVKY